jgi:hypothetical protein
MRSVNALCPDELKSADMEDWGSLGRDSGPEVNLLCFGVVN